MYVHCECIKNVIKYTTKKIDIKKLKKYFKENRSISLFNLISISNKAFAFVWYHNNKE